MVSCAYKHNLSVSSLHSHFSNIWTSYQTDCFWADLCLLVSDSSNQSLGPVWVHQAILLPLSPLLSSLVQDHSQNRPVIICAGISLPVLQCLLTLVYTGNCVLNSECTDEDLQIVMQNLGMVMFNFEQEQEPIDKLIASLETNMATKIKNEVKPNPNSSSQSSASSRPCLSPAQGHLFPSPVVFSSQLASQETSTNLPWLSNLFGSVNPENKLFSSNHSSLTRKSQINQEVIEEKARASSIPLSERSVPVCSAPHCSRPQKGHQGAHGSRCSMPPSSTSVLKTEKWEKCNKCGKKFLSSVHLVYHTDTQHVENTSSVVKCRFCPFSVKKERKDSLLFHLQTKHAEYHCNLCQVLFKGRQGRISPHKRFLIHNNEKHQDQATFSLNLLIPLKGEHSCTECDSSFPTLAKLYYHTATCHVESGTKVYKCIFCSYTRNKTHGGGAPLPLLEHLMVHTGEKDLVCKFCGEEFRARKTLVNHERLHTGDKKFKCEECDAKFVQLTALKSHLKAHHKVVEEVKGLKCKFCGSKFKFEKTLANHEKLHTEEEVLGM